MERRIDAMGRIRSIKPEFPHSESMGNVSRDSRLTFIMLWTLADDSGRLRGSSRMLASLLFPYDDDAPKKIDGWLTELEKELCIERYAVDGSHYIQIHNWLSHQKIDHASASKIPPKPESSEVLARIREGSWEDQGLDRIKDQGLDRIKESSDDKSPESSREDSDLIREVFDHYRTHHPKSHPTPQSKSKEWKAVKARLKEGHSVADLKLAIDGCHRSAWHQGENDRATKYDSLELIVRDSSKVAQFMELANGPNGSKPNRDSDRLKATFNCLDRVAEIGRLQQLAEATVGTEEDFRLQR